MNEQACAFVCAICCAAGVVLSSFCVKTGDFSQSPVVMALSIVVVFLSGLVLVYRHL